MSCALDWRQFTTKQGYKAPRTHAGVMYNEKLDTAYWEVVEKLSI